MFTRIIDAIFGHKPIPKQQWPRPGFVETEAMKTCFHPELVNVTTVQTPPYCRDYLCHDCGLQVRRGLPEARIK